jgi:hypothetical protein
VGYPALKKNQQVHLADQTSALINLPT